MSRFYYLFYLIILNQHFIKQFVVKNLYVSITVDNLIMY